MSTALPASKWNLHARLIPGVTRIGVLINSGNPDLTGWRDVETAGSALAVEVLPFEVGAPNDLDAAFAKIAGARVEAIVVLADPMFFSERRRIIISAAAARLPTIWSTRVFAEDDGLLSYGIDEADSFRRAAGYVAKILKGAKGGRTAGGIAGEIRAVNQSENCQGARPRGARRAACPR